MLLVTAFEPFDGTGLNSSQQALSAFLATAARPLPATAILPVAYGPDAEALARAVAAHRPTALLHLGQGHGAAVAVERLAVNLQVVTTADGRRHQPILADGPVALPVTAPVEAILAALAAAGILAVDSGHAGTFVCNHLLYRSLRAAGGRLPVAFLHLPRLPSQAGDGPSLPVEVLARAVAVAAEVVAAARSGQAGVLRPRR